MPCFFMVFLIVERIDLRRLLLTTSDGLTATARLFLRDTLPGFLAFFTIAAFFGLFDLRGASFIMPRFATARFFLPVAFLGIALALATFLDILAITGSFVLAHPNSV